MLLTITNSSPPVDDLGYLLHKNPANLRSVDLAFGTAHVFSPELNQERCSISLLLEVDPVGLVRRGRSVAGFALADHVNDRPYVTSSLTSVAIARLFGTAMSGRCDERPDRVDARLQLTAHLPVVPCRDGEPFVRRLFEPWATRSRPARSPSIRRSMTGERRGTSTCRSRPRCDFGTCSRTSTCCFRCSMMRSTTGCPRTRSRSC